MTRPSRQNHQTQIFAQQKKQFWVVFICILVAWLMDMGLGGANLIVKGVFCGALLSYIAQSAFTWTAYRVTGSKNRQIIMLNMYLGQVVKWVVTLLGFALIFITIKPINALAVFLSYFVIQVSHNVAMWRIGRE